jgi:hypothetical protein
MPKKNRLNPNPANRSALLNLKKKGVLRRQQVGIRHIIRASTNTVETIGFDLTELHGWYSTGLSNFGYNTDCAIGWVTYNGGRADLRGTQGVGASKDRLRDFSRRFPVNQLATDLINQKCTKGVYYDPALPVRGDAALVTDMRAHWYFSCYNPNVSIQDIQDFNSMLTSPRDLIPGYSGRNPWIFFHQEPNERDIIMTMMRWV